MSRFALLLVAIVCSFAPGCTKAEPAEVVTLAVEGMTCDGCEGTVRNQLEAAPGVVRVDGVDHETKRAIVVVKAGTDTAALCGAVKGDYSATVAK